MLARTGSHGQGVGHRVPDINCIVASTGHQRDRDRCEMNVTRLEHSRPTLLMNSKELRRTSVGSWHLRPSWSQQVVTVLQVKTLIHILHIVKEQHKEISIFFNECGCVVETSPLQPLS